MLDVKYSGHLNVLILLGALFLAFLMVSNFRYPSFKKINLNKSVAIKVLVLIILIASIIYLYPVEGISIVLSIYTFYGVFRAIKNIIKAQKISKG